MRCKAGWETHGLPVEVEVCKELGIHSKEDIENYGIEPFIQKCQQSVWRYMQQWRRMTERIGFWVNLDEAYVTYHQSYVESVWWSLKQLFDRGLLYQGHKIVWWWAQGGTALSAGEVGQGYREVADPSVYVRFPLRNTNPIKGYEQARVSLLIWTTTPWTLPGNQFVAVNPKIQYSIVHDPKFPELPYCKLIVATDLLELLGAKLPPHKPLVEEARFSGSDLVGKQYIAPFGYFAKNRTTNSWWRVVPADFVTTDSGTGIVHIAPAFGEDDFEVLLSEQSRLSEADKPELFCPVQPDGKYTDEITYWAGRPVMECNREIIRTLKERAALALDENKDSEYTSLLHQEQFLHEYPFCCVPKKTH